jgi:hypothetical protein
LRKRFIDDLKQEEEEEEDIFSIYFKNKNKIKRTR